MAVTHDDPYVLFVGTGAAGLASPADCDCEICTRIREDGGKSMRRYASLYVHPGILIDHGTMGMESLEHAGVETKDVKCLLITHSHDDHFTPEAVVELADARAKMADGPLHLYGNSTVIRALEAHLSEIGRSVPVTAHPAESYRQFEGCGWTCTALGASHEAGEDCLLYLLKREGFALLYATDTTWFPVGTFQALREKELDIAIVEGTFGHANEPEYLAVHMSFDFARLIRDLFVNRKTLKPGGIFALTHLGIHFVPPHDEIAEQMAAEGILIPYDGLKLVPATREGD